MNLGCDLSLGKSYKNKAQIARVLSEAWCEREMYCVSCISDEVLRARHNTPGFDFACPSCESRYQLKANKSAFTTGVPDGAYETMLRTLREANAPHFLLLSYDSAFSVRTLTIVPSFFLTEVNIEKRTPLSATARRAGWIGCNIRLSILPKQARITVIENYQVRDSIEVRRDFAAFKSLECVSPGEKGWTIEVLKIVNSLPERFALKNIYQYESTFKKLFPRNEHIRDKLRQQLQILRDNGVLKFDGGGRYTKLIPGAKRDRQIAK